MAVVTVSANSSAGIAFGYRFCVDAFAIGKQRTIANTASLHDRFVAMTSSAGLSYVRAIYCRLWIRGWKDGEKVIVFAVAIETGSGFASILNCLRVEPAIVGCMDVCMKLRSSQVR
jgi:hypothetical protein